MTKTTYFGEYCTGTVREAFGRTIPEADILTKPGKIGGFFPHHIDAEWAKSQEFGHCIAYGTLILNIDAGTTAAAVNPATCSYGYDSARFYFRYHPCGSDNRKQTGVP